MFTQYFFYILVLAFVGQTPSFAPEIRAQMEVQTAELRAILQKSQKLPLERVELKPMSPQPGWEMGLQERLIFAAPPILHSHRTGISLFPTGTPMLEFLNTLPMVRRFANGEVEERGPDSFTYPTLYRSMRTTSSMSQIGRTGGFSGLIFRASISANGHSTGKHLD